MTSGTAASKTMSSAEARLERELAHGRLILRLALDVSLSRMWEYDILQDRFECSADERSPAVRALNGSLAEVLAQFHADDRPRVERTLRAGIERGDEVDIEARVVLSALSAPRGKRWLLAKGLVERDIRGRPSRIMGVARDNTRRKEGDAVRLAQAQGERLRALGEMASGIAHDLNQSLALISGYSEMARQELSLDAPDLQRVREMVDITGQAAIEGGNALRGLLSFVRSQELMAEAERVDVSELLRDVARLTAPRWRDAPQADGRPIDLTVDVEPECAIDGSSPALREAITNLIFNAVDAMPQGGVIRLGARRADDRVFIEVSDSGTGIPSEIQSRIFDPFFTTKGERGTGLGLPQVLGIVERHGGTIEVDSDALRGTTFKLAFPGAASGPRADKKPSQRPTVGPQRCVRVLVVEDEDQLARMASLVLTQRGHRATVAASGDEALAQLEDERFELIISDLGLGPGKNGWELAQVVRQRWPATRFVLVTGWGAAIDPEEARARGVDRVIAKPYRIADLRQVADDVAAALDNS